MEHSSTNGVSRLLTLFGIAGLLPHGLRGEIRVAINTLDRPDAKIRDEEAVRQYLGLLDKDIDEGALAPLDETMLDRLEKVVANVQIDLENDEIGDDCEF